MTRRDEFYIGYEPQVPPGIGRVVTVATASLIVVSVVAAIVATLAQRQLPDARFDYGRPEIFRGWLSLAPLPTLYVDDSGAIRRYWLVGRGKFGADALLTGIGEGAVELEGTLIAREHWRMLEVVPGTVRRTVHVRRASRSNEVLRRSVRLRGEIVDSKCFLGVMNPGESTAHRDCAVRCLSGGVPAMFAYRELDGSSQLALLMERGGRVPTEHWRRFAGTTIDISGELVLDGDQQVLVVEAR
jgi:hypothetical protein